MPYVLLLLFLSLVFGKVYYLQRTFGFGGEVVNMPAKMFLIFIFFSCILRLRQKKSLVNLLKVEKWMFAFFALFVLCGCISGVYSQYHAKLYPQFMDVFNYGSFVFAFYGTLSYFQDAPQEKLDTWLNPSIGFAKILTLATFGFWFVEQIFGIGMTSHDTANRLFPPYEFIYYHGTYLITIVAFSFLLLYNAEKKYLVILCLLCLLSARDRGYLFLMLFLAFSFLAKMDKFNIKFLALLTVIVGLAGAAISFQKIEFYTNAETIRASFYVVAVALAVKYFPLGAGLCTIGTWNAFRYKSPVFTDYYQFFVWADENEGVYGDSGFSSIIGQTGFLGTFFYLGFMVLLFFSVLQRFKGISAQKIVCAWILFSEVSFFVSDLMISNFAIISGFFVAALYLIHRKEIKESSSSAEADSSLHQGS